MYTGPSDIVSDIPVPHFLIRELRAYWRLACVAALISGGLLVVLLFFPLIGMGFRRWLKRNWSRLLVFSLGVRIEPHNFVEPACALLVCNHISWLDVFVLNALSPTTFVCKDEVKSWPALGTLVKHSGTLFIERGSRAAAARTAQAIAARIRQNERVAVFPEGTTTQGTSLLPFRAALFQAAIEAQAPTLPISLRYLDPQGELSLAPAYDGDVTFAESMMAIARAPRIRAHLTFLPALAPSKERRVLAAKAEAVIARALGLATPDHDSLLDEDVREDEDAEAVATTE